MLGNDARMGRAHGVVAGSKPSRLKIEVRGRYFRPVPARDISEARSHMPVRAGFCYLGTWVHAASLLGAALIQSVSAPTCHPSLRSVSLIGAGALPVRYIRRKWGSEILQIAAASAEPTTGGGQGRQIG